MNRDKTQLLIDFDTQAASVLKFGVSGSKYVNLQRCHVWYFRKKFGLLLPSNWKHTHKRARRQRRRSRSTANAVTQRPTKVSVQPTTVNVLERAAAWDKFQGTWTAFLAYEKCMLIRRALCKVKV